MKKKYLNKGRAERAGKGDRGHSEFISLDQVNRYMVQMSDEELEAIKSWRELIAKILETKPENIEWLERDPKKLGYRVKVVGDIDDLEKIMDNNVGTLKRLKGTEEEENDEREDLMADGKGKKANKDGWMSPEDMGIAQKIDWSDAYGNEISRERKMAYFRSLDDMYEVDDKKNEVRLKPEKEWFRVDDMDDDMDDDDMEDWEREGYNSEIAYQNRWRDYRD